MENIPVLKIGPILLVSIQTELHDSKAAELQDTILYKIRDSQADAVLIDITAMDIVDSFIARILSETAHMAGVMAAKVVLVGMRPAVTMTLVDMGMNLPGIDTAINIQMGLSKLGYELKKIQGNKVNSNKPALMEESDAQS